MQGKGALFDLFGTLVNTVTPADYNAMLVAVAEALGAPAQAFSTQWRAEIEARESGRLGDVEELLAVTARNAGCKPSREAVERAATTWLHNARRWLTPREGAVDTVKAFRTAGYRIGVVSNCSAEVPRLWNESPLHRVVDAAVFSCQAGVMKPDPAIYRCACLLLGVPAERCLFTGDGGARELTAAGGLGMTAVLIRVPGEEHTWFDDHYRRDALEWGGQSITAIEELAQFID